MGNWTRFRSCFYPDGGFRNDEEEKVMFAHRIRKLLDKDLFEPGIDLDALYEEYKVAWDDYVANMKPVELPKMISSPKVGRKYPSL